MCSETCSLHGITKSTAAEEEVSMGNGQKDKSEQNEKRQKAANKKDPSSSVFEMKAAESVYTLEVNDSNK